MASTMKYLYYDILRKKLQCEPHPFSSNERNFLMCESCFWCASFLNSRYRSFNQCPSCMNSDLESMPISANEIYTFDYDPWQGVTLEFWNNR
jgi:hypothetical protein